MGIKVEFNPDLNLRNIQEFKEGRRAKEECLPEKLVVNEIYDFLKSDQRNYWLGGELPLRETQGKEILSRPKASIIILEVTHFTNKGQIYTKGKYQVIKVLDDKELYFEGLEKLKSD